ncbi:MAG: hypothetical protein GY772_24430 [bacterium]|nr:hypothetical protein [bacterium]
MAKEDLVRYLRKHPQDAVAVRYSQLQQEGSRRELTQFIRSWQSDPRCRSRVVQADIAEVQVAAEEATVAMTAQQMRTMFGDAVAEKRMQQYHSFADPVLEAKGEQCDDKEDRWYCVPQRTQRHTQTCSRQLSRQTSDSTAKARPAANMVQGLVTCSIEGSAAAEAELEEQVAAPAPKARRQSQEKAAGAPAEFKTRVQQELRTHRQLRRQVQKVIGKVQLSGSLVFAQFVADGLSAIEKSGQLDVQLQGPSAVEADLQRLAAHTSKLQGLLDCTKDFRG